MLTTNSNLETAQDKIKSAQRILASGYLDTEALEQIDRLLFQARAAIKESAEMAVMA